jgi:branched-chain amino acid transport system permease protein
MNEFIAFSIIGIVIGATYAVAASGLVVTYATSGVFNIAHGAIGMVMAFVYWQFRVAWNWPAPLALAIVILVIAPLFGAFVERVLIRRVREAPVAVTLVITGALMVFLIGMVNEVWKPKARILPEFFGNAGFHAGSVFVNWAQVITVAAAIAIALGLRLFLYRTRTGVSMRAVVDNQELAGLNGARPARISTYSWALGSMLASIAGILIAPSLQLSVLPLTLLIVDAYAAAMVGRLRNLPLTFVGALGIGLLQSYAQGYMPTSGIWASTPLQGMRLAIPAILLFIILLALPQDKIRGARQMVRRRVAGPASARKTFAGGVILVAAVWVSTGMLSIANVIHLGTGLALALVMLSLVPLTGWGGQVSLCQMTFAGLGAFAMSRLGHGGSPWGLLAAAVLAGVVGGLIALPALRLRGLYLALATLAFAAAMDDMFFPSSTAFGYNGSVNIPRPTFFGIHISTDRSYVIFLAVVFALLSAALLAMRRGPFGRVLSAMKDSEAACATLGLNLTTTKLIVFTLSAAIAGVAGALYGAMVTVAGSTDFLMLQSLPILILVVVLGVATASGALFGGVLFGLLGGEVLLGAGVAGVLLGSNPDGVMPWLYSKIREYRDAIMGRFPGSGVGPGATAIGATATGAGAGIGAGTGVGVGAGVGVGTAMEMGVGVVDG